MKVQKHGEMRHKCIIPSFDIFRLSHPCISAQFFLCFSPYHGGKAEGGGKNHCLMSVQKKTSLVLANI